MKVAVSVIGPLIVIEAGLFVPEYERIPLPLQIREAVAACRRGTTSKNIRFLEPARVFACFDHVASIALRSLSDRGNLITFSSRSASAPHFATKDSTASERTSARCTPFRFAVLLSRRNSRWSKPASGQRPSRIKDVTLLGRVFGVVFMPPFKLRT